MDGSFWPLAWQARTTVEDDFSFPVVRIDTVLVPNFLHSAIHGNIKDEWNLVHVDDVLWMDLLFSYLVFAVCADSGQLFLVIFWQ